jgi:hypothetical protein
MFWHSNDDAGIGQVAKMLGVFPIRWLEVMHVVCLSQHWRSCADPLEGEECKDKAALCCPFFESAEIGMPGHIDLVQWCRIIGVEFVPRFVVVEA